MNARTTRTAVVAVVALAAMVTLPTDAQQVEPPFNADYTVVDLGAIAGLPAPNGGLTFLPGDPNTLVIAGNANDANGEVFAVPVVRDVADQIVGFGPATMFAEAPYNDGGVMFGPDGVLFLSRFPLNEIGQVRPGSTTTDKITDLYSLGINESPGGLMMVPDGFPGAGQMKLASWGDGGFYTMGLVPDGAGTFDITSATMGVHIDGGPEGFVYIPPASPQFADFSSMLVADWSEDSVSVYSLDANGDPIPTTRQTFLSGVIGPQGAAIDPLTGDFLFSTFTGANETVVVVRGFGLPVQMDPDDEPECVANPQPEDKGYWRRECAAVPVSEGGLRVGNRGPKNNNEPGFREDLMPCADQMLADLGLAETTCSGMDASPANDRCEKALQDLTALALNVCSDRVQTSCTIDVSPEGCDATTAGEMLEEAAELILTGYCQQARMCVSAVNESVAWSEGEGGAGDETAGPGGRGPRNPNLGTEPWQRGRGNQLNAPGIRRNVLPTPN